MWFHLDDNGSERFNGQDAIQHNRIYCRCDITLTLFLQILQLGTDLGSKLLSGKTRGNAVNHFVFQTHQSLRVPGGWQEFLPEKSQ